MKKENFKCVFHHVISKAQLVIIRDKQTCNKFDQFQLSILTMSWRKIFQYQLRLASYHFIVYIDEIGQERYSYSKNASDEIKCKVLQKIYLIV